MTPPVSFLLRFVLSSGLVSNVVVGSCERAWSPLSVDIISVACRLQEVSDMSMRSGNYHVRDKELTDLLSSVALSFVVSCVVVLANNFVTA